MDEQNENRLTDVETAPQRHGTELAVIVDPPRAVLFLAGFLFMLFIAVSLVVYHIIPASLLFFVLALLCAHSMAIYGATVRLDATGVSKSFFGLFRRTIRWEEAVEAGSAGSRVFTKGKPTKVGTLYLYVSSEKMDDNARFVMMLKWPQLGGPILMRYTVKRVAALESWWKDELVQYNTGRMLE